MRAIYRHVELLSEAGMAAAVWHRDPAFRCGWFEHSAAVVGGDTLDLAPDDLLVVPEVLVFPGFDPAPGARKAIFNQGYFQTFDEWRGTEAYPGWQPAPAIWATSEASAAVLGRACPGLDLHRVPVSVDTALFRPAPRKNGIAWMPRRRASEARLLERLWRADPRLSGVELIPIDGVDEVTAARLLGAASVFVALGEREGFGRPPAEALAAGCLVVGYPAGGGAEVFQAPGASAVADADVLALADRAAELALAPDADDLRRQAREWVTARYPAERERDALLAAVSSAAGGPAAQGPVQATHPLHHLDHRPEPHEIELDEMRAELLKARSAAASTEEDVKELSAALDDATAELAATRRRAAALADELRDRRAEQAAWQAAADRVVNFEETSALLAQYTRDTARLNDRLDDTIRQKMSLEARVLDLEGSTSWRVTAPLRRITGALKGERHG